MPDIRKNSVSRDISDGTSREYEGNRRFQFQAPRAFSYDDIRPRLPRSLRSGRASTGISYIRRLQTVAAFQSTPWLLLSRVRVQVRPFCRTPSARRNLRCSACALLSDGET